MTDAERLADHTHRTERTREHLARAAHLFKHDRSADGALALLDGLGSFMGMIRDYGDAPRWFREAKFEHQVDRTPDPAGVLFDHEKEGWEAVSVIPDGEGFWLVFMKRWKEG